jgi:hypothetical protein
MDDWDKDRRSWTPLTASKHVIIELLGGDADGLVLDSSSKDETERRRVETILWVTNNGEIGHGMQGSALIEILAQTKQKPALDELNLRRRPLSFVHCYLVKERLEEHNEVLIRIGYEGKQVNVPTQPP